MATLGLPGMLVGNLLLEAKAEEPKITRRGRAETEEFETRLEGDFVSRSWAELGRLLGAWRWPADDSELMTPSSESVNQTNRLSHDRSQAPSSSPYRA